MKKLKVIVDPLLCQIVLGVIFYFTATKYCDAQNQNVPGTIIEYPMEQVFMPEVELESLSEDDKSEAWESLLLDPVCLNEKDPIALARLYFLNHEQINKVFQYLVDYGPILSIYELIAIEGIDLSLARQISMVTTLQTKPAQPWARDVLYSTRVKQSLKFSVNSNFESLNDYMTTSKADSVLKNGSPIRMKMRYNMKLTNGIACGIAGEKDPGESFFQGKQKQGFDFYSGYLDYQGKGILKRLIVGDFQVSIGQGLWIWNAYMPITTMGANAGWINSSHGLNPVSRTSEGPFFRGLATGLQWKKIQMITFLSSAGVNSQSLSPQTCFGTYSSYRGNHLEIGVGVFRSSVEILKGKSFLFSVLIRGKQIFSDKLGADFKFRRGSNLIYGELSRPLLKSNHLSYLFGFENKLRPNFSASFQFHSFPSAQGGSALCTSYQGATCSNNQGWLIGLKFQTSDRFQWVAATEHRTTSLSSSTLNGPGINTYCTLSLVWTARNGDRCLFRMGYKEWEANQSGSSEIIAKVQTVKRYDVQMGLHFGSSLKYEMKLHFLTDRQGLSNWRQGWLIHQMLKLTDKKERINFSIAYTLFDTDDWFERLYLSSSNSSFGGSFQALSGQGSRAAMQLMYKYHKKLLISVYFTRLNYYDRASNGSGATLILNSCNSDIGLQLQILW
ncbi:MAG: hypothetical protein WCO63_15070 [Bacteroidota bacterium]